MSAFTAYDDDEIIEYLRTQVSTGSVHTDDKTLMAHSFSPLVSDEHSGKALAFIEATSTLDIQGVLKTARKFHLPVVTQDYFTSTVIGADGIEGSLLLSTAKMNKILEINHDDSLAVVEPGVINADLDKAARKQGMFFAPDPGSKTTSGIGGNVATNAGGMSTVKYGSTKDNVLGMKVILADGRELKLGGRTLKQAYGYDLTHLFVGSEGTLGIITEITVKLLPIPLGTSLMGVASFSSMDTLAKAVAEIRNSGVYPTMLEAFDHNTLVALDSYRHTHYASSAAMLIFKIDSAAAESEGLMRSLLEKYHAGDIWVTSKPDEQKNLMQMRWDMLPAVFRGQNHIMEDMAVPLSKLAELVDYISRIGKELDLKIYTAGHAGDGNVHPTIVWPKDQKEAPKAVTKALRLMFKKSLELGGTISGEHSVGMLKNAWNNDELGCDVDMVQHQIKSLLDPMNILNPRRKIN